MKKAIYLGIQYMKQQKGRTFSLIIGIALAVMLVFSLNVIPETESKIETKKAYKTYSDYHVEYNNLDKSIVDKLRNEEGIRDMYTIINLGDIVDKNGITMELNSYDEDFIKEYGYKLIRGTLPKNENEIVLESKALEVMGINDSLNKNIKFTIEKRYKDENGENKIFSKEYSFKLVGVISKQKEYYEEFELHRLKAFTYYKEGENNFIPTDLIKYGGTLSFSSKAPSMSKINKIISQYRLNDGNFIGNVGLIQTLNLYDTSEKTKFDTNNKVLPMFTAVIVIYNIFNIVLLEMTNQIGILKAIGASKKHIRMIILIQSLLVLIFGIIGGVLLGIVLSYIGLATIYNDFINLYISKISILEPMTMASITVLLASLVPIYKSGKISPIEAIRETDTYNTKQNSRVYYKFIRKIFGITSEMACKNVWRNKVRTILSILAISLGGSLYIDNMALYNAGSIHEKTSWTLRAMGDIDINLIHNKYNTDNSIAGYSSEDINKVSMLNNVESIESSTSIYGFLKPKYYNLDQEYVNNTQISKDNKVLETELWMQGYDESSLKSFDKYIEKGSTDLNKYKSEYPNVLVYNYFYNGNNENHILKNLNVGDLLTAKIPTIENNKKIYKDITVRVAGLLNRNWGEEREIGKFHSIQIVMNQDELWKFTQRNTYNKISIKIKDGSDKAVHKELEDIVKNEPYGDIESKYKYNQYYEIQEIKNKKIVLLTVSLVLIISSINIICTIKTNLLTRIHEFATLRAIGMNMKKLKNMIMKESIIYGLLGGLLASIIGTYKHYKFVSMVNQTMEMGFGSQDTMKCNIPIIPIIQYMLVCILICIIAVLLVRHKIEKLSIVEGLNVKE